MVQSQVGWESSWGDDALVDLLSHFTGSWLIEHAYLKAGGFGLCAYTSCTSRDWRCPSVQEIIRSKGKPRNCGVANVLHVDCPRIKS